jgi:hypothetical protein
MKLSDIRAVRPCKEGWAKLLTSLGNPSDDLKVSLGDVALSNGPQDAYWCLRAMPWDADTRASLAAALAPCVAGAAEWAAKAS